MMLWIAEWSKLAFCTYKNTQRIIKISFLKKVAKMEIREKYLYPISSLVGF